MDMDLAKHVLQVHGVDAGGKAVLKKPYPLIFAAERPL
jgi:hypothetical protein